MTLSALQTCFQDAILGESREILSAILPSQRLDSALRFAIYADAYRARLSEFLANDYPVLRLILGDEDFGALGAAYIDATPSHYRNARWYVRALPNFMDAHAPWCEHGALIDLAVFERALADAFDAAEAPVLDATALAAVAAEDQPRLCFAFAPSLALLTVARETATCYEAASEGRPAPMPVSTCRETILVWRDAALAPLYRILEEDEALALAAATRGADLAEICTLLGLRHDAETAASRVAQFLARWFSDGLVTRLSCG